MGLDFEAIVDAIRKKDIEKIQEFVIELPLTSAYLLADPLALLKELGDIQIDASRLEQCTPLDIIQALTRSPEQVERYLHGSYALPAPVEKVEAQPASNFKVVRRRRGRPGEDSPVLPDPKQFFHVS